MAPEHISILFTKELRADQFTRTLRGIIAGIKISSSLILEPKLLTYLTATGDTFRRAEFEILARGTDATYLTLTIRADTESERVLERIHARLGAAILPGNRGLDMTRVFGLEPLFPPVEER